MTQNTKLKQLPTKSGGWLEAECLKLARRTLGRSEIQYVTIRRLHPKGTRPNWKVADLHQARARDGLGRQGCSPSWHKAYTA